MFWCTNCNGKPCIQGLNGLTSFRTSELSKRINKTTRTSSSMHLMKKATLTINELRPTFQGQSDRNIRSVNPITKKVGVDKKHNSYARYLARKKGKTICCCTCTQLIKSSDTGSSWSGVAKVGMTVKQDDTLATGVVIAMTFNGGLAGDIDTVTIRSNDCKFEEGTLKTLHFFKGNTEIGTLDGASITVTTLDTCNGFPDYFSPPLPKSALI